MKKNITTQNTKKQVWDTKITVSEFATFTYVIKNSYEISPLDTWILKSRPTISHLTLFTCTPIGTNKNRWYIDAELE